MVEIDRAEFEALVSLVRKLYLLFGDFLERLEKIEAEGRAQKVSRNIREDFLGQGELMEGLLGNVDFMAFFRKLNSKRGGYVTAIPIVAATFPKGRYITVKSLMDRLRRLGWTKQPDHYYIRHVRLLGMKEFRWCEVMCSEKEKDFTRNLFDYKVAKGWRKKPDKAFCAGDAQREKAFDLLREEGLGAIADFIREKTS